MSAWGPNSYDNELATAYANSILVNEVYPHILQSMEVADDESVNHRKAYKYDRLIASLDLLIFFSTKGIGIPAGYIKIALLNLHYIRRDIEWFKYWRGIDDGGTLTTRGNNYVREIQRIVEQLKSIKQYALGDS